MKKTLNIIAVLLLVMVTLVTFGCKPHSDQNFDKVKSWKVQTPLNDTALVNCLEIKATKSDITWWVIADEQGVLYEENEDYVFVDKKTGEEIATPEDKTIKKDESVVIKFKFEKAKDVVLVIHQPDEAPREIPDGKTKEEMKGTADFRGKIRISPDSGRTVPDSEYGESTDPYGVLKLTCDETGKSNPNPGVLNKGSWSGDYSISELWPLSQNEGTPEWTAKQGMKFIFEEGDYIGEGETRKVIFPAGKLVVALKQPDRLTEEERQKQPTFKGDEPWYESTKEIATNGELHDNFWWCIDTEFPAHDITAVTSNSCNKRFLLSTGSLYEKSVLGATYLINDSDIVYGGYDK